MSAITVEQLRTMSSTMLDRLMREGYPVDRATLANREFDGVSLNLPHALERATWTKFAKVFHEEEDGSLRGWNCKVVQTPLEDPWALRLKDGAPITYGHYKIRPTSAYPEIPRPYLAGLMLDYGLGGNGKLDPTSRLRDPIVSLDQHSSELLLGWSYLDLGLMRTGTPSFFALRRGVELSHIVSPPHP